MLLQRRRPRAPAALRPLLLLRRAAVFRLLWDDAHAAQDTEQTLAGRLGVRRSRPLRKVGRQQFAEADGGAPVVAGNTRGFDLFRRKR
jgi:hypothetical protein